MVFWASRAALSVPCDVELLLLEPGKKAMLLAHTHRQILGRSGGAKKGGGRREATGSFVSLGGVGLIWLPHPTRGNCNTGCVLCLVLLSLSGGGGGKDPLVLGLPNGGTPGE